MGIFSFLGGKSGALEPGALRERLFDAAAAQDQQTVLQLCRQHADRIAEHFPSWRKVPEDVRTDPRKMERYASGLIGVARCFADHLGRPELWELLQGKPESNPIESWQKAITQVRALARELAFDQAVEVLSRELASVRKLRGGDSRRMLAITLGTLGECHFQGGAAEAALAPVREALALCEEDGDEEGVLAYAGTLYEAHRYLGQGAEAAGYAARRAALLRQRGEAAQARRFDRLAELARAGEPLNRVVAEVDGVTYEMSEVPPVSGGGGSIKFHFARNRPSLAPVQALVKQGEALGSQGRLDDALEAFRRAAALDRHDPEPRYKLALTLLYLRRPAEAVEQYQSVEAMAPGWYQARADLWLACRLAEGTLPHEALLALVSMEGKGDPAEKVTVARRWLKSLPEPELTPFHHALGRALHAQGDADEARAAYDRGLRATGEPDLRTRLLVDRALLEEQDSPDRTRLLGEAVELNGNLLAAAMASVALRGRLS
ncbi:MAG TPA: hypothetical protein VND93_32735 [Myxococcales bacterium]|nr:hypothetical protein [Myxococcales bacterium]